MLKNKFNSEVNSVEGNCLKKLIIDLQRNAGDYLDAAIHIYDHFLKKEKMANLIICAQTARPRLLWNTMAISRCGLTPSLSRPNIVPR